MPNHWFESEWIRRRFWSYVDKDGEGGCWVWNGRRVKGGYGQFGHTGEIMAHRRAYRYLVGAIPDGLTLDHLCHNTWCVNPNHLEPVPLKENILRSNGLAARNARKTHCKYGHPFSGDNLRLRKGGRDCLECRRRRGRESMERWREKRLAAAHYNGGHPHD